MIFSLNDYQEGLSAGAYAPPNTYCPFMRVNRKQYRDLEKRYDNTGNGLRKAFRSLRKRIGREHYGSTYPIQLKALHYSRMAFPAYRFILPEVLADDWLATVDWHRPHRDHILHQPLTAYIVLKLLTGGPDGEQPFQMPSGQSLLDECVDKILKEDGTIYLRQFLIQIGVAKTDAWLIGGPARRELWKALFIEAAYLAAVFHDMGYPWQYVNSLGNKLEHAGYQPDSPTPDAVRVLKAFGNRLLFCPFNGYILADRNAPVTWHYRLHELTAKALRRTHGLPGAIGFLYLNDVLREYPIERLHPIRQFCVEWAAMAIAMHDMPNLYWGDNMATPPDNSHMRVRLEVDPLSCVVALADVLQDFSRPIATFRDRHGSKRIVEVRYDAMCESIELELSSAASRNEFRITYQVRKGAALAYKNTRIADEQKQYFDTRFGYLDLSSAGITQVDMQTKLT